MKHNSTQHNKTEQQKEEFACSSTLTCSSVWVWVSPLPISNGKASPFLHILILDFCFNLLIFFLSSTHFSLSLSPPFSFFNQILEQGLAHLLLPWIWNTRLNLCREFQDFPHKPPHHVTWSHERSDFSFLGGGVSAVFPFTVGVWRLHKQNGQQHFLVTSCALNCKLSLYLSHSLSVFCLCVAFFACLSLWLFLPLLEIGGFNLILTERMRSWWGLEPFFCCHYFFLCRFQSLSSHLTLQCHPEPSMPFFKIAPLRHFWGQKLGYPTMPKCPET